MTANERLVEVVKRGYVIDCLGVVSRNGKIIPGSIVNDPDGYLFKKFNLRFGKSTYKVKFGRLMAYQKYGDEMFRPGIIVRHLDGNSLNNSFENIEIGTNSQNMLDKSKAYRQLQSKYANRKCSDETIELLKLDRELGMTYKELTKKYNIAKSTASYYLGKPDRKRAQVTVIL